MNSSRVFVISSVLISAIIIWLYLLTQVQPNQSNVLLMVAFFGSLFVWLGGALAAFLYWLKVRRSNREIIYAFVRPSIRQGFLTAGVAVLLLALQLFRVVTILEVVLIIAAGFLFEFAVELASRGKLTS